ncbi:MAG: PorP/SprF family type IX secretion system membrane protein [Chitinophagaceae bacterium]
MGNIKYTYYLFLLFLLPIKLFSQDISLVQYWNSTQTINPALSGSFNETWRTTISYGDAYQNIRGLFTTIYGAIDYTKQLSNAYGQIDQLGITGSVIYDQSNNGGLSYFYGSLSGAYHKSLDFYNQYHIGLGFKASFGNQLINYTKLSFGNQFIGDGTFNPNVPSGELLGSSSYNFFDASLGVLFQAFNPNGSGYTLGLGVDHLGRPRQSQFDRNRMPIRYNFHAHYNYPVLEFDYFKMQLLAYYLNPVYNFMIGGYYAHDFQIFTFPAHFLLGAFYQYGNIVTPYVGFENKNFLVGITYDFNFGLLRSQFTGSLEISAVYKIPGKFFKPRVEIGDGYAEHN